MGVIGAHVSPISPHQHAAICRYRWLSILSGGHQFGWLGHSQNSIFSSLSECLRLCCLLKSWPWIQIFPLFFLSLIVFYTIWHRQWLVNSATRTDLVQIQSITLRLTRESAQNVLGGLLFFLVLESLNFWAPYRASISVNSPRNIESIRVTVCGSAHAFSAALYRYSECPVKWCILPNIANSNHSVRSRVVQSAWPASPCFTSQPTATKIYGAYRASSEHTQDTECCIFLQLHFIPLLSATHGTNGQ